MNWWLNKLDNPIVLKHVRSNLRQPQIGVGVGLVTVVAGLIVMVGYQVDRLHGGGTFIALMLMQMGLVGVGGAVRVGASVTKARESSVIDFHRVSPLSPAELAAGFFLGGPIRENLMFLATIPFSLLCVAAGPPTVQGFLRAMTVVVLVGAFMQSFTLLNSLIWKSTKNRATTGVIIMTVAVVWIGVVLADEFDLSAETFDLSPTLPFYVFRFPFVVVLVVDIVPAVGFFLLASARKLADERAHAFTKGQAIAGLGTAAFLLVGNLWGMTRYGYWTLMVLYLLISLALVMVVAITPSQGEFSKAVRSAEREGRKHPSSWSDPGLNRLALAVFCLIVLAASTVVWSSIEDPIQEMRRWGPVSYSLSIAIGVLAVAVFGLAWQYFQIRAAKRAHAFMALFLLTSWIFPMVFGSIIAASVGGGNSESIVGAILMSMSPIAGISMSSGLGRYNELRLIQGAALMPTLGFFFLFNNLVTSARRRVDRQVQDSLKPKELAA